MSAPARTAQLPNFLPEDYLALLRGAVLLAWIGVAGMALLKAGAALAGIEWPQLGGFAQVYNLILLEFALTAAALSVLAVRRDWFEGVPRDASQKLQALLTLVVAWLCVHHFFAFHLLGGVQGPVLPLLPLLIATAFLALPRDGAWAVAALLVAGHAIVVLMQQLGWIGEPPFGPVFALGTAPGLLVLCAGVALAVVVGLSGRARFDRAGANLNRDNRVNPLTGLYEQGFLRERLETELERQRRQGGMLTLMLIEFDGFAPYTAEAGYDEGRRALQRAAEVLIENTRHDMDTPARYAATTFALLLPDARLEQAPEIAARIRAAMTEVSQGALRPRAGLACVTRAAEVSGDLVLATARRALQQSHTDAPPTQLQLPEKAG